MQAPTPASAFFSAATVSYSVSDRRVSADSSSSSVRQESCSETCFFRTAVSLSERT